MSIGITDRYKLIFEEHHYASDFRVKIIQGWFLFYAAFLGGLGWTQASAGTKPVSWILTAFAALVTLFMWAADFRHRKALAHSKRIGQAIETFREAAIPEGQRFFTSIKSGWLTHSLAIDVLSGSMIGCLSRGTIFLKANGGDVALLPSDLFWWAFCGSVAAAMFHASVGFFVRRSTRA